MCKESDIERCLSWEVDSLALSPSLCFLLPRAQVICWKVREKNKGTLRLPSILSLLSSATPPFPHRPPHARPSKLLWIPEAYTKAVSGIQKSQGRMQPSEIKVQSQHKLEQSVGIQSPLLQKRELALQKRDQYVLTDITVLVKTLALLSNNSSS